MRLSQINKTATELDKYLEQYNEAKQFVENTIDVGAEYSNEEGTLFGAFLQEMSNPAMPYRVQWYDGRGLVGHSEAATVWDGIDLLLSDLGPGLKQAPGSMDKLFFGWHMREAIRLLGKSLYDIDFSSIPADYVGIDESASMDQYLMYYAMHKGYDPYDYPEDEITEDDPAFKEWLRDTMEDKFIDIEWTLKEALNEDETIDIWRKMTVPENWLAHLTEHGKHLGVYWSYDEHAAEAHWGERFKIPARIHGRVPETSVDWETTFIMNMDPSLGEDEKEVRLHEGVPVEILEIEIDGVAQDISALEGRDFYA